VSSRWRARIEKTVGMRGTPDRQLAMLTTLSPGDLIPADHPIRRIRVVVDTVLADLDHVFDGMYAKGGRASVPPETLLKATVLMAMYSIRSERAFCERLNYDLLFKWFLDMRIDQPAFDPTTFTKNRQRLLEHEVADEFFAAVVKQAKLRRYVSSEHFSVDGTLLKAWASHKSFKPKDGPPSDRPSPPAGRNAEVGWHGQKRSNTTHASTTDPEARLYRKSNNTAATLCYSGHLLMENRSALIVDAELTTADGYAERATALAMLGRLPTRAQRRTVAGDKGYDTKGFVADARGLGFTPHVAPNTRHSAIDARTTRHPGHAVSMRIRKRIEEPFGWIKTIAGGRQLRYRGRDRNRAWFKLTAAVYNLIRITALDTQPA
jgi:transposase